MSTLAAGLALGFARVADARRVAPDVPFAPNLFIQIDPAGVVTITCHRSEMGQGIRSTLPVLLADELGADASKILIVQADGDERYGDQNTDGSTSIRKFFDEMRTVAAVARTLLVTAAAARWKVPADRLVAHDDAVHDPKTGKAIAFRDLLAAARALPVPRTAKLRPLGELAHLGKELPLRDAPAYVTGAAKYGADIVVPDMLIAAIANAIFALTGTRVRTLPVVKL